MVSFRRWFLALTVLALFAGLASAQVQTTNTPLNCNSNVSVTPTLRSEGITEQIGDIIITCTGGSTLTPGATIPQANITIALNQAVTSRLLPITNVTSNASEALLLIDEPGSGLPGYGPSLPQSLCTTPLTGCVQYVGNQAGTTLGTAVAGCTTQGTNTCTTTNTTPGSNVFQGIVNGNQVTFFGVPILPPVTTGAARVFRITNVRVNATTAGGGTTSGPAQIVANILTSGSTPLPITQPTPIVGFVQQGLTAGASNSLNPNQCSSITRSAVGLLTFTEGFGSSFKTRVAAQTNGAYAGQISNPTTQNIPGTIYNSESGLILGNVTGNNSAVAGQADYGTRLKAVFSNVQPGVRLFVSTVNVNNAALPFVPTPTYGAAGANTGTTPAAQLISTSLANEAISDGTVGGFPAIAGTDTPSTGNTPIVEIPVDATSKTAVAVWEVVNTNPNTIESIKFGVYSTFVANVAGGSPGPGAATVTLSFAPTSTVVSASSSAPIPRFNSGSISGNPFTLFTINICRTVLLYPFLTASAGFDSGVAISNTSSSPASIATGQQSGTCELNFFQATGSNPPPFVTPNIPSGSTWSTLVSAVPGASTFGSASATGSNAGYMIAVCNFQFAHGYAFVSDVGIRNFATSYLALVIPDPGSGTRAANPLSAASNGTGEAIAQ